MALVSLISTRNVDWPRTRLSDAPTRVNRRSTTPTTARRAGTKAPIWASTTHNPTCLSSVDFPAMFGPVRRITRPASSSSTSFGMKASRAIMRSTTGWRLHPSDRLGHADAQRVDELRLARRDSLLGTQHLGLVRFQLGRDEPLGAGQRLASLIVRRHAVPVRVRDLQVIAEDLVETDLERGDAGALALARLEPGDVLLPAVASVLELVELVIVPGSDRVAIGRLGRRALHQRPGELVAQVLEEIEAVRGFLEQRCPPPRFQAVERRANVGQTQDGIPQCPQLARGRAPECGTTRQAFDVAYPVECFAQAVPPAYVADQDLHGIQARGDGRGVDERREQPCAQQAGAHGRHGAVEHAEQRGPRRARVELPRVAEQRPHRAQGGAVARLDAEPVEGCHPEGASQILAPQLGVEFPRLALGAHGARKREGSRRAAGKHELPGFVASEHRGEVLRRHGLEQELAGREIERRNSGGCTPSVDCQQEIVPAALEPVVGEDAAGGDGLHDRTSHEALRELGILHLLADRHAVTEADQPPQVLRRRLDGNAGEGHFRRTAIVPRREGETQFAGGELRVVLEHFVEVTHPEEQDGVGVSCFDLAILLHQRGVRLDARRHGSSTTNGWPPSRVLMRRWACAASSCDAYRPTRTLNKPLVSRTTRASKPITFRRVSISSTCAALFTANTWTAYVAAGDAGFA